MDSAYDHLAVGLPHSDIRGSTIARISPRLFAACYVLHRLLVPRHPPNALQRLISTFPRNRPDPCGPGRPISLLIPRQPRQPLEMRALTTPLRAGLRSESRSPACRREVLTRNSPSNTRRSSRSRHQSPRRPGPKPSSHAKPDRRFQVKASVPSSPCQTTTPTASAAGGPHVLRRVDLVPFRSDHPAPHRPPRHAALVEADGIEPTTPCLQSRCSPTELRPLVPSALMPSAHARGPGGPGKI
jgi:hypothetical protein